MCFLTCLQRLSASEHLVYKKVKAVLVKWKEKHSHIFQKKLRHRHGQWVPGAGDVCSTHTLLSRTSQSSHQGQLVTTEKMKCRKLGENMATRTRDCEAIRVLPVQKQWGPVSGGTQFWGIPRRRLSISSSATIGEWAQSLLESAAPTSLL